MTIIRTLHPDDSAVYRDLRLRALTDSPAAFGSIFEEEYQRPNDAWVARLAEPAKNYHQQSWPFMAEVDGIPVGLAWAKLDVPPTTTANLYHVWVTPEARGLGVGAALLNAAITWARERRATALHLDVTVGDSAAARLYRRSGFVDIGAPKPMVGRDTFEQEMVLILRTQP